MADLAVNLKLSPGAVEFYINESSRFGSPLANIPLTDALQVSSLADQSGKGAFVLDYLARYGMDNALRNASPEGLQFYVKQAKVPGSTLSELTTQQGVTLSQLTPASIAKVTGMTKPIIPEGVVPDISTPVLNLTSQEISVLTKLCSENPNAKYAVLGLWKNGQGYTVLGSEGYTYLNMPSAIYDTFFKNYPGDFRLINEQFLKSLATEGKPIILETPYSEILKMEDIPSEKRPTLYWEIIEVLESQYKYFLQDESGPGGYDLLVTEK